MAKLQLLEPRNLALAADLELEGAWRVEYFDSRGAAYITIFAGQSVELRARNYYDAIERGGLSAPSASARPAHSPCLATTHRISLQKRPRHSGRTFLQWSVPVVAHVA